ncbi:hypothetical protein K501DRAFT_322113 [Backusella circina FSU 941]|nr:hypothetical protein K501DRAFT_322113 [Backusella circina FSU 941]
MSLPGVYLYVYCEKSHRFLNDFFCKMERIMFGFCSNGATASISSPLTGTVYTAGSDATIAWYNPVVATISQINLLKGPASALVPVASVATNVDASLGQYVWTIPAGTAAGNDYAFGLGSNPNVSYTGFFTINAGTGAAASGSSSAAAGSSSAAAGSSSAAAGSTSAAAATSAASSAAGSSKPSSSAAASASSSAAASGASKNVAAFGVAAVAGAVAAALI